MIDFHTHIFPEKIADRTIAHLAAICHAEPYIEPYTNGKQEGLLESMEKAGVDCSVNLPVVTSPSQFRSVNQFAANLQHGRIISFGGIHPQSADYKNELKYIKSLGIKGIKLHPDYQETYFNDISYKRIISYASELDLIVAVHAGLYPKSPKDIHCTPQMDDEVIKEVSPTKMILAHMGGNEMWDDVERYLVGKNVWFDTGVVLDTIPQEQFLRIVRTHGADKILFATDSPWAGQKEYADYFQSLPMTAEEKECILHKNAEKLLRYSNKMVDGKKSA